MSTNPRQLGKYELRERLGSGGMAEVWKGFDTQLHRYVAIKILHANLQNDPEFITRFVREARAIASLHHPNIVQIYDFQTVNPSESSNSLAYMVMDYVEGQTLAEYLRHSSGLGKSLSATDIVNLFASISRAIDYAHRHDMIHRDIKPANILLDKRNTTNNPMGEPILSDFGIAKLIGVASGTVTGTWLGTPMYTSPEQAQGQPGNERSDIYSLGIILYEICTGEKPFRGETITAIMMQHITTTPTAPDLVNPDIPPALSKVILRCLAKDPAARFSSASALTAAVAEALNVPIPADMRAALSSEDGTYPMDAPTVLVQEPGISQSRAMSSPGATPVQVAADSTVRSTSASHAGQVAPETPVGGRPAISSFADTGAEGATLLTTPAPPTAPAPPSTSVPGKRRRGLFIPLIALVILVVLGSGVGAFYWLTHSSTPTVGINQSVGHVFLLSSGQVNEQSSQGINDELQIDLHNLSNPASGKAFYAWLLSDKKVTEASSILLSKLTVTNGGVQFHYTGDAQHSNLLASYSRFLITEEDANPTPIAPSVDRNTWRYYSELAQTVNPVDNFSLLDHLRHLLAKDPDLEPLHLPGGLDIWLFRNTQKIMQFSGSAKDCYQNNQTNCLRKNVIRILDYLDGKTFVQTDVPPGTPNLVDPRLGSVALLEFDPQNQNPPGYLYHINKHLQGIIQAPGATQDQRQIAAQIDKAINQVTSWLQQVRTDAKKLMNTPDNQLLSQRSLSLLNDMDTQAGYAYSGQLDPATNQTQGGVLQIHHNIERLATFNVTAYTSS